MYSIAPAETPDRSRSAKRSKKEYDFTEEDEDVSRISREEIFFLWWKNELVFTWLKDMMGGRFRVVLILCLVVLFPVFFVFTATASSNTNIEEKTRYTVCGS